jgi:hypothetical protein
VKRFGMLVLAALLAGCGANDAPDAGGRQRVGREETRRIRTADTVGVAGSAVADRLDRVLDASDARRKRVEEQSP